jgi:hypothetical protein
VTLKGHVISKTGSMTGGTSGRDGSDRWEEKVSALGGWEIYIKPAVIWIMSNIERNGTRHLLHSMVDVL